MPVLNYYSVGGQIVGEKPSGGNRRDYLTDALGSVVGTVTSTGAVENTYRYKPYGGLLARTGVASDPSFLWVGSQGYRQTGKKYSDVYVRARHYSSDVGRWTTRDPIGYDDGWNQYGYVQGNPINGIDPSGLYRGNCGKGSFGWRPPTYYGREIGSIGDPTPSSYLTSPVESEWSDLLQITRQGIRACLSELFIKAEGIYLAQGIGDDPASAGTHWADGVCTFHYPNIDPYSAAADLSIVGLTGRKYLTVRQKQVFCKIQQRLRDCGFVAWHRRWGNPPANKENEIHLIDPVAPCIKDSLYCQIIGYTKGLPGNSGTTYAEQCKVQSVGQVNAMIRRSRLARSYQQYCFDRTSCPANCVPRNFTNSLR